MLALNKDQGFFCKNVGFKSIHHTNNKEKY